MCLVDTAAGTKPYSLHGVSWHQAVLTSRHQLCVCMLKYCWCIAGRGGASSGDFHEGTQGSQRETEDIGECCRRITTDEM